MFALAGCGSGTHFADKSRPATPVNLTVYVNNAKVSLSPSSVGAGPVIFIITNQASQAVAVDRAAGPGGAALATTAPINPQATSSVSVDFRPGAYTVATAPPANTLGPPKISSGFAAHRPSAGQRKQHPARTLQLLAPRTSRSLDALVRVCNTCVHASNECAGKSDVPLRRTWPQINSARTSTR